MILSSVIALEMKKETELSQSHVKINRKIKRHYGKNMTTETKQSLHDGTPKAVLTHTSFGSLDSKLKVCYKFRGTTGKISKDTFGFKETWQINKQTKQYKHGR